MLALLLLAVAITLAPLVFTIVSGVILPLVVDFATKSEAPRWVKELTLGVLAVVAGVLAEAVTASGGAIISLDVLIQAILAYIVAFIAFRTPPVHRAADTVQARTAPFGVG